MNLVLKPIGIVLDTVLSVIVSGLMRLMVIPMEILIQTPLFFISKILIYINDLVELMFSDDGCESIETWAITEYMNKAYEDITFIINNIVYETYSRFGLIDSKSVDKTSDKTAESESPLSPIDFDMIEKDNSDIIEFFTTGSCTLDEDDFNYEELSDDMRVLKAMKKLEEENRSRETP